jgi:UDP-N-acetylmuramoylalanine--D-glutamate ligase
MSLKEVIGKKKIAVFGIGISGKAAIQFLIKNKISTLVWDQNTKVLSEIQTKYQNNKFLKIADYKDYNWSEIAYLILAAGVPLTHPNPHEIVQIAKQHNCPIISDVEILYKSYPNNIYIGITGTNGKSTTTSLLGNIFKTNKVKSDFGGNLGNKGTLDLRKFKKEGVYIIEMSSYMLDLCHKTKFHFSILLNITPDHYDRHKDLEGYIEAKKRIFLNQDKNCYAIINTDNKNCQRVYEELKNDNNYKGNLVPISVTKKLENGFALINGIIYNNYNTINKEFLLGETISLKGQHNAENIICAFAVSSLYGLKSEKIIKCIKKFKGLDHRLQFIKKIKNISFINDSKATTDMATEQALKASDNIYWILGGRSKPNGITTLTKYFNKIIYAFLIGEATEAFSKTLDQGRVKYFKCDNLENAFHKAYELAKQEPEEKEIDILLSPVCASFDQWPNFEKRGEYFVKLVKEIKE